MTRRLPESEFAGFYNGAQLPEPTLETRVLAKLADRDWREETDAMYLPAAWPLLDADDPIAFAARMKQLREERAEAEATDEMYGVCMTSPRSASVRHFRAQFPQVSSTSAIVSWNDCTMSPSWLFSRKPRTAGMSPGFWNSVIEWKKGGGELPSFPHLPVTLLRVGRGPENTIETSRGSRYSVDEMLKFWRLARRARRTRTARQLRMRIGRYGGAVHVTATHAGDLRIGCQLVPFDELRAAARRLGISVKGL
jgi:hypothetical protein